MCGIFAYIGTDEALKIVLDGLTHLEYRGYDSAGLAIINKDHHLRMIKRVGNVQNLKDTCESIPFDGNIGIGHVRWATHGQPSDRNSHPLLSMNRQIAVVHNGVVENYKEIKDLLVQEGFTFNSDTDSEVLCNLVQYIRQSSHEQHLSLFNAVNQSLQKIVGTFGVCFIDETEPNTLVVARRGVPVILGIMEGKGFCVASDNQTVQSICSENIIIGDNEIVKISRSNYMIKSLSDFEGASLSPTVLPKISSLSNMSLDNYPHYMIKEICNQAETLKIAMNCRLSNVIRFAGIEDYLPQILESSRIMMIGSGGALYAAQIGQYLFEEIAGITCRVEPASEMVYKIDTLKSKRDVLFVVSPSGENQECLKCVRECKKRGILTVGIVNIVGTPISQETDCGIFLHAGQEYSTPCTKVFNTNIMILSLIALRIGRENNVISNEEYNKYINEINQIPDLIQSIIDNKRCIEIMSKMFIYSTSLLIVANGMNYPIALDAALLLKQTAYIHSEAILTGEIRSGPVSLFEHRFPCIIIAPKNNRNYNRLKITVEELYSRDGELIIITDDDNHDFDSFSDHIIPIPSSSINECFLPLLTIVPLQLFSYYVGKYKKCPIDQPRNMAKYDG